jgi:hypothetical protein
MIVTPLPLTPPPLSIRQSSDHFFLSSPEPDRGTAEAEERLGFLAVDTPPPVDDTELLAGAGAVANSWEAGWEGRRRERRDLGFELHGEELPQDGLQGADHVIDLCRDLVPNDSVALLSSDPYTTVTRHGGRR